MNHKKVSALKPLTLAISFLFLITTSAYAENPFVGHWQTIDDSTGEPRSIIKIQQEGDELTGKIVKLLNPSEENPICDKCSGDKKNQPITGLQILWGLEESQKNYEWSGGRILDPENGRTYNTRLRLKSDGQELEVRGFIGFSLLGRTQTWVKTDFTQD